MSWDFQNRPLELRARTTLPELWIQEPTSVTKGIAKVGQAPPFFQHINLIRRNLLAQAVATILAEVQIPCYRMEIKSYRVAHALCNTLSLRPVWTDAKQRCVLFVRLTNIARSSLRHNQGTIGSKADKLPPVI